MLMRIVFISNYNSFYDSNSKLISKHSLKQQYFLSWYVAQFSINQVPLLGLDHPDFVQTIVAGLHSPTPHISQVWLSHPMVQLRQMIENLKKIINLESMVSDNQIIWQRIFCYLHVFGNTFKIPFFVFLW